MKNKGREEARRYAFLLLKFRLRAEKELYLRLEKKKFPPEVIKDTLDFLKAKKFIDDDLFARVWIESRIKKPLGLRRLKAELVIKGVEQKIIEDKLNALKPGYSEEKIIRNIVEEKLAKLKRIEPQKAKQRIYSYLLRRGFSPDVIIDTLNELT